MDIKKPNLKTLDDLINYSTLYDIRKYSKIKDINGINVIDETLFDVYYNLFKGLIQRVTTLPEHKKYNYNPKWLSKDLYGTPDLDWLLLRVNNSAPSRFKTESKINYIHPDDIDTIFDILASKISS
jgi:hypothetical protein